MKSIIVTRSDDLLKISVPGRIWDQIDFHVDVSYTIDDYDVAETVLDLKSQIEDLNKEIKLLDA